MKTRQTVNQILGWTLVVLMTAMVLNVLWQVFSRYVLGAPSSFTDELARYLMIWLGVLGAAYVSGQRMHVAIDVIPNRLSPSRQRRLGFLVNLVIILFCFFGLIIGGSRLVYVTWVLDQFSPALGLPLAVVYLVLPLSGLLIIYYKTLDLLSP
ncbi:TRAP transporter small permease [Robiginitalea sp. M366]|uniref:TRAP transporter small permease n=1 Tax=Robiginitalea aestuariiviva TaxID=3036903 RepID=UPI00240E09FF|nr:TRAP transporter small permease [Robiginitalea aestuariiviva]MDG1571085.1 TRAP transporter small permease [Robiginitalea aestuariiviva]